MLELLVCIDCTAGVLLMHIDYILPQPLPLKGGEHKMPSPQSIQWERAKGEGGALIAKC
jgi:hypothetical protein